MELEYIKSGEYLIPNLTSNIEPSEPLTKYGLMRRSYLKEHRTGIYSGMMPEQLAQRTDRRQLLKTACGFLIILLELSLVFYQ